MRISYKEVKKVKHVRTFFRPKSVFADWQMDTPQLIDKAFGLDTQFMKTFKFIKDPTDLADTLKVLKEHFVALKSEFLNMIANVKWYPVVTWLEYSQACKHWQLFDQNLSPTDIDRIFIAVNYEEVDLENNDDSSLCRYEFSEILARIGKTKFVDKGLCSSIAAATRKVIEEHILPNSLQRMAWQEWRETRLWNLEVDDLLKANLPGILQIYQYVKSGPHTLDRAALSLDDACKLMPLAGYSGNESEANASYAYVLSKQTPIDEMAGFASYNTMTKAEFYEFVGRLAELMFEGDMPLVKKIARLLDALLQKFAGTGIIFPDLGRAIDTDSDCDDDLVSTLKEEILDAL